MGEGTSGMTLPLVMIDERGNKLTLQLSRLKYVANGYQPCSLLREKMR